MRGPDRRTMTPEEQVRAAFKVLKPPSDRRAICRASIENALGMMAMASSSHRVREAERSKAYSKARRAYHSAARRMRATIVALLATGGGAPACLELERMEEAISASEPLPQQYRARASIKPTWAVALAWDLATKWGRSVTLTVGGDWWRLAAILYGRVPLIDLYRHMLAFEPELSPFRGWF